MIIDAHMHLWDRINGRLGKIPVRPVKDGVVRIGSKRVQGMPTWFGDCRNPAETALAAFDDAGVSGAVVTQEYLDGNQNRYLLGVKKKYPDRFFVHGLIDFTAPRSLAAEFRRVLRQGFEGIKCPAMFLPALHPPIRLDQPELMEIWQQMQAHEMILSIDLAPGAVQAAEMKHVIQTFPRLNIVIGHFGMASHRQWKSQILLARAENVYIESGGIIWLFRGEGTQFEKAQDRIRQAADLVGAEKLMWGSDYPRTMVDFTYRQSMDFVLRGCRFFSESQKAAFLGENAAKLYGFKKGSRRAARMRITEL